MDFLKARPPEAPPSGQPDTRPPGHSVSTKDASAQPDIPWWEVEAAAVEDEVQDKAWDVAEVIGPMLRAGVATDEDMADMVADRLRPIVRQKHVAESVADVSVREASEARKAHRVVCEENRKLHDEIRRLKAELITGRSDYVGRLFGAVSRQNARLQDDLEAALDEIERLRNANVKDR